MGGERKAVSLGVGVSKGPGVCCALRVRVCCVLCEDGACLHIFIRISSRGWRVSVVWWVRVLCPRPPVIFAKCSFRRLVYF